MVPVRACKDQTLLEIQNCVSNRLLDSVSSKWGCYQSTYGSDAYATYLRKKATCFFCNSIPQQLTLQGVADTQGHVLLQVLFLARLLGYLIFPWLLISWWVVWARGQSSFQHWAFTEPASEYPTSWSDMSSFPEVCSLLLVKKHHSGSITFQPTSLLSTMLSVTLCTYVYFNS